MATKPLPLDVTSQLPPEVARLLAEGDPLAAISLLGKSDPVAGGRLASALIGRQKAAERAEEEHTRAGWFPMDARDFLRNGRMLKLEWLAGEQAKDEAVRFTRERWLPRLEAWLAAETGPLRREWLAKEIRRLQRCLGITRTAEERREQTRERVRRLRARRRGEGAA